MAEEGFDPNLGARPLKRVIQRLVLDPLSLRIVAGEIKEKERIQVDFQDGKITFMTSKDLIKASSRKRKLEKVGVK